MKTIVEISEQILGPPAVYPRRTARGGDDLLASQHLVKIWCQRDMHDSRFEALMRGRVHYCHSFVSSSNLDIILPYVGTSNTSEIIGIAGPSRHQNSSRQVRSADRPLEANRAD